MNFFSENVENELLRAINNNEEIMLVLNGKLVTIETREPSTDNRSKDSLVVVIECKRELKGSLYRYIGGQNLLKVKNL